MPLYSVFFAQIFRRLKKHHPYFLYIFPLLLSRFETCVAFKKVRTSEAREISFSHPLKSAHIPFKAHCAPLSLKIYERVRTNGRRRTLFWYKKGVQFHLSPPPEYALASYIGIPCPNHYITLAEPFFCPASSTGIVACVCGVVTVNIC